MDGLSGLHQLGMNKENMNPNIYGRHPTIPGSMGMVQGVYQEVDDINLDDDDDCDDDEAAIAMGMMPRKKTEKAKWTSDEDAILKEVILYSYFHFILFYIYSIFFFLLLFVQHISQYIHIHHQTFSNTHTYTYIFYHITTLFYPIIIIHKSIIILFYFILFYF